MSTLSPDSYWSKELAPHFAYRGIGSPVVLAVDETFSLWATRFKRAHELFVDYERAYFIGRGRLTTASQVQDQLGRLKAWFYDTLLSSTGLNYFGKPTESVAKPFHPKSKFDKVLEKRVSLASCLINGLYEEPYFGRTKLAKLFYLADVSLTLDLNTSYEREAAGPLDKRALYHAQHGIEALGKKHGYYIEEVMDGSSGKRVRYKPGPNINQSVAIAKEVFGTRYEDILRLRDLFRGLDTERCEIVATLFAAWNDFLLRRKTPTDGDIIDDVRNNWHESKTRFERARLANALRWMRDKRLVPQGGGRRVNARSGHEPSA